MKKLTFDQLPEAVSQISNKLDNIERLITEKIKFNYSGISDQLLTVHEAAEFLSLSIPTIYSKVSRRELPVMKRAKRLYFSKTELLDYLKAGRKKSNAEIEEEAESYLINRKKGLKNGK